MADEVQDNNTTRRGWHLYSKMPVTARLHLAGKNAGGSFDKYQGCDERLSSELKKT